MAIDVDKFLADVSNVSALSIDEYSSRLRAAILATPRMGKVSSFFQLSDGDKKYGQNDCTFGGVDCKDMVTRLGIATASVVLSKLGDARGFNGLADGAEAAKVRDATMQELMPWLFLDHINRALAQGSVKLSLADIRKDDALVLDFKKTLSSAAFNPITGREDHHYAETLLFIYEFFEAGADMKIPTDPSQLKSKEVLAHWSATHPDNSYKTDVKLLKKFAGLLGRSSATVFNPTRLASAEISSYLQQLQIAGLLFKLDISDTMKQSAEAVLNGTFFDAEYNKAYQVQGHTLLNSWQEQIDDATPSNFWRVGWTSATSDHKYDAMTAADWYGDKVFQWVNENSDYNFIKKDHIVAKVELYGGTRINPHTGDPIPTCFAPGTQIMTFNFGTTAIEELREGTQVLTRADPQQWGICSSETVKLPCPERLFGINGEGAFFTAGHPFFTTTGLRAIDPEAARRENPWIEVGTLKIGHQLLRVRQDDTSSYETVEIRTIEALKSEHQFVYGVHLREGLRSYHANGYLVALNYPEITVASVAQALQSFPPQQRLGLLAGLRELAPLLQRFGGSTVLELLEREAKMPAARYGGKPHHLSHHVVLARDVNMSYIASDRDSRERLAQVELHTGVLLIDGEHCERVAFEKNSVVWSRRVGGSDLWEHAWCTFSGHGIGGQGRMFRSDNLEPTKEEVAKNIRRFLLIPGVLKPEVVPDESVAEESIAVAEDMSESRPAMRMAMAAPPMVTFSRGVASMVPDQMLAANSTDSTTTEEVLQFTLQYDANEFKASADETSFNPTIPLGTTSCGIEDGGAVYSTLVVDSYAQIRNAIMAHAKASLKDPSSQALFDEMPQFFDVCQTSDWKNRTVFEFESNHASRILQSSDQYQQWITSHAAGAAINWKEIPLRDLTFTNLGMDASFKLPLLFTRMRLWLNASATKVNGVVAEYNPVLPDSSGTPHWVSGTIDNIERPALAAVMASVPAPQNTVMADTQLFAIHSAPHSLSMELAANTFADEEEAATALKAIPYNQSDINAAVQRKIANIMSYHLDDSVRETFFGTKNKPDVPVEYGPGLDNTPTRTWLRDTYAPAYICMVLSQQESLVAEDKRFSKDQKKRIKYFWNGQGKDCLAQSQIFHALERSVTRHEIRAHYKDVGDVYKNKEFAIKVSDKILSTSTSPTALGEFGREKTEQGCSRLTRLAAIMDALDDGKLNEVKRTIGLKPNQKTLVVNDTNSNHLTFKVMAFQGFKGWNKPFWGNPNLSRDTMAAELELQWYHEAMAEFIRQVLDHDPALESDIVSKVQKELVEWAKTNLPGWDQMDARQKQLALVASFGNKIRIMRDSLGLLWKGTKALGKAGAARLAQAPWMHRFQRVQMLAAHIAAEPQPEIQERSIKGMGGSFMLMLLGVAALVGNIWQLQGSPEGLPAYKTGLLVTGIIGSVRQVAGFGLDVAEAILEYRVTGAENLLDSVVQQAITTQLDEAMARLGASELQIAKAGELGEFVVDELMEYQNQLLKELERRPMNVIRNELEVFGIDAAEQEFARLFDAQSAIQQRKEVQKTLLESATSEKAAIEKEIADLELKKARSEEAIFKDASTKQKIGYGRMTLQVIGYLIAVAVAIFVTWQLIKDWKQLEKDTPLKWLSCIQVALAIIEGVLSAIILTPLVVAGFAALVGLVWGAAATFAASALTAFMAMASFFASVLTVIAIVAMVVMLVTFMYLLSRDPPPSPATQWVMDHGSKFADRADLHPPDNPAKFAYTPEEPSSSDSSVQPITMTFTNGTNADVSVDSLAVQFSSGHKNSSLFWDGIDFKPRGDTSESEKGCYTFASNKDDSTFVHCYPVSHATDLSGSDFLNITFYIEKDLDRESKSKAATTTPTTNTPAKPDTNTTTAANPDTSFKLRAGEVFTLTLYGTIYGKKEADKDVWPTISVTQEFSKETRTEQVLIKRKCV